MGEVGDALAAPRVASVAGEKSMWWSPEKGVRTKKAGQSGEGAKQEVPSVASHRRPCPGSPTSGGVVGFVGSHALELSCTGTVRLARNTRRSEKTDHFHVTSEARASCELAS